MWPSSLEIIRGAGGILRPVVHFRHDGKAEHPLVPIRRSPTRRNEQFDVVNAFRTELQTRFVALCLEIFHKGTG